MHAQNVRDFPQTKLDSEITSPDPRLFQFQVFAKNSVKKENTFEEEKQFDSETRFYGKIVPNWVYFGQGEDFKVAQNSFHHIPKLRF